MKFRLINHTSSYKWLPATMERAPSAFFGLWRKVLSVISTVSCALTWPAASVCQPKANFSPSLQSNAREMVIPKMKMSADAIRLTTTCVATFCVSAAKSVFDIVLPTYAMSSGLDVVQFTRLASARMGALFVGVFALGFVSGRLGEGLMLRSALLGAGATMLMLGLAPPAVGLFLVPVAEVGLETAMLNLNALTQRLQFRQANTLYRMMEVTGPILISVALPVLIKLPLVSAPEQAHGLVFCLTGLLVAGCTLFVESDVPVKPAAKKAGGKEQLQEQLMCLLITTLSLSGCLALVKACTAYRFKELHSSSASSDWAAANVASSLVAFMAVPAVGMLQPMLPGTFKTTAVLLMGLNMLALAGLSFSESPTATIVFFAVQSGVVMACKAPVSQWTAHIVRNEPTQLAPALAMQKLVSACYKVSATMCGASLMQLLGISHTYGIAALATAVCIMVLSLCGPDSAVFSREASKLQ